MTELKAGQRLRSQVCTTEVIVVRTGDGSIALTCGGLPLVAPDVAPDVAPGDAALMTGSAIGKRYTSESDATFELLVTKGGDGTLGDGTTRLVPREAKPLPASD
jgi:hypothetical protein